MYFIVKRAFFIFFLFFWFALKYMLPYLKAKIDIRVQMATIWMIFFIKKKMKEKRNRNQHFCFKLFHSMLVLTKFKSNWNREANGKPTQIDKHLTYYNYIFSVRLVFFFNFIIIAYNNNVFISYIVSLSFFSFFSCILVKKKENPYTTQKA